MGLPDRPPASACHPRHPTHMCLASVAITRKRRYLRVYRAMVGWLLRGSSAATANRQKTWRSLTGTISCGSRRSRLLCAPTRTRTSARSSQHTPSPLWLAPLSSFTDGQGKKMDAQWGRVTASHRFIPALHHTAMSAIILTRTLSHQNLTPPPCKTSNQALAICMNWAAHMQLLSGPNGPPGAEGAAFSRGRLKLASNLGGTSVISVRGTRWRTRNGPMTKSTKLEVCSSSRFKAQRDKR
mmetsp:Transcript_20456/g.49613  ORF Transcript_20456/g.49613 Transcript_20456/m.49613 type:complete len:240 (-) Transcript_20456:4821-5540(-)